MLGQWLKEKLDERQHRGLHRALADENKLLDFTSNDYLGLSRSEKLFDLIAETVALLPKKNGSTGSRLLSGNSLIAGEAERKLAGIFKSESALLFNSGYSANLAVLSSLPQKGDTIIYDSLAHASLKDGARLSLASRYSFRHNDLSDLEKKINTSKGKKFIVVESVYSMDGDQCPLPEIIALADKHDAAIILDEAHSTGVIGPLGAGCAVEQNVQDKIDVRIYTFGKGMGVHGACVAGSDTLIRYLVNFARPFIYTTALPLHDVVAIQCAFKYFAENSSLQQTLRQKIDCYLSGISRLTNRTASNTAIQTILVPGNENIRQVAATLQDQGFDVRPILSPTVSKGMERLRICLHTFNNDDEIIALTKTLASLV